MSDELRGLPTRTGTPTGHANERQMLEKIRDNLGFETTARVRPDGSYTLLRTKGGMPRFITDPVPPAVASIIARGFLARATAKPFGAIFDPYDLDIEVKQYKPASITYCVGKVQAAAYEPRKWRDVWSWDGSLLRINGVQAKTFYPLKFPADVKGAIPYIIPWPSAPIYGTKETNSPFPKRVFAVGPESVGIAISPAYGGASIATVKLHPETPRSNRKALVCGAAIDPTAHEATLSQIYFTGALWDSLTGGWAYSTTKVAMLLTVPFLQATNASAGVDMVPPALGAGVGSSGNMTRGISLPATEIALIGTGESVVSSPYAPDPATNNGLFTIAWPWTGVVSRALIGEVYSNYTRTQYSGAGSASDTYAGVDLSYSASNVKLYDVRDDYTNVVTQDVTLAEHATTVNAASLSGNSTSLWWGGLSPSGFDDTTMAGTRGITSIHVSGMYIGGSSLTRSYEEQTVSCSVSHADGQLISVEATRFKSSGPYNSSYLPNTDYYDPYLANPYGRIGSDTGTGLSSFAALFNYSDPATDLIPIRENYKRVAGVQDPSAASDINAKYIALRDALQGQVLYDSEQSDGSIRNEYSAYYSGVTRTTATLDDKRLEWQTTDCILFDALNETSIAVRGEFVATQSSGGSATATLSVSIVVKTPHAETATTLYTMTYGYSNMLPETVDLGGGRYAIPSPQIRAIFAPAFREQGAFRGAAYVTADEESNGAAPAIVVNFVLALETYAFIGEDEPTDKMVHFVPCNLLEMLYAFVYSRGYGIDPTSRYPITDISAYNAIMAALFGVQHPIHYRDGAFTDWMAGLGNPYYADKKTELSRV